MTACHATAEITEAEIAEVYHLIVKTHTFKEIICLKRFLYRKKQNRIVISRKIFYKTLTFGK